MRAYQGYWERLKNSNLDTIKKCKLLRINVPFCMVNRAVKAIRKEKDRDWEFKMENIHDPWILKHSYKPILDEELTPHSIVTVTLKLDRRSDL